MSDVLIGMSRDQLETGIRAADQFLRSPDLSGNERKAYLYLRRKLRHELALRYDPRSIEEIVNDHQPR